MTTQYAYFATDGSYGDATDLILIKTETLTNEDWMYLDGLSDDDRADEAFAMALNRDSIAGHPILATDDEVAQMVETLEGVIQYLTTSRNGIMTGWAEQLGDIRDVLTTRRTAAEN